MPFYLLPKRLLLAATIVAGFFVASPLFVQAQSENQAVILQYHHVSTSTPPVTSLSPESFSQHMDYLENNGFIVLPLEEVILKLRNGTSLPDKSAVITFDDGYASVYEVAFPELQRRGWSFTVFVTSGLVGTNDRLYSTWEQIREMADAGVTIANHTIDHPYLLDRGANESEVSWLERVRTQIVTAEETITQQTGQNHKILAYPYGEYDPNIQTLVQELGFVGIAQHSGPINASSDFTALPRFPFSGIYASMNSFPTKVLSLAFTLDSFSPHSPLTTQASPQATLNFGDEQKGLSQLACFNNNSVMQVNAVNSAQGVYEIKTEVENKSRRFRYNCTAPGNNGRYYWYSIPWINPAIKE